MRWWWRKVDARRESIHSGLLFCCFAIQMKWKWLQAPSRCNYFRSSTGKGPLEKKKTLLRLVAVVTWSLWLQRFSFFSSRPPLSWFSPSAELLLSRENVLSDVEPLTHFHRARPDESEPRLSCPGRIPPPWQKKKRKEKEKKELSFDPRFGNSLCENEPTEPLPGQVHLCLLYADERFV